MMRWVWGPPPCPFCSGLTIDDQRLDFHAFVIYVIHQSMSLYNTIVSYVLFQLDAILSSGFPFIFWVRPQWTANEMGDQTNKVVMVTGGNSGTGYATCKAYFERGATVYMASRSESKAMDAIRDIQLGKDFDIRRKGREQPRGSGKLVYLKLDLADLQSIDDFVAEFKKYIPSTG